MRNILVHDYLSGIDLEQVWDAIAQSLPSLEVAVKELSERFNLQ
nr:HepT-like ribonuclease domain-containing protein [Dactylococcopsis salina]